MEGYLDGYSKTMKSIPQSTSTIFIFKSFVVSPLHNSGEMTIFLFFFCPLTVEIKIFLHDSEGHHLMKKYSIEIVCFVRLDCCSTLQVRLLKEEITQFSSHKRKVELSSEKPP